MSGGRTRIGIYGYGYVGRGTAHAFGAVADVGWHDPADAGSRPFEDLAGWADVVFVCVPTPMSGSGAADVHVVEEVLAGLAAARVSAPVLIKSTVPPGTTEALAARWGLPLVFTPEFLRERHHLEDALAPARVALGWSASASEPVRAAVRALVRARYPDAPVVELTATEAELLKYSANALFGVKVAFANELAELADRLGASWDAVRDALVLDPRVGSGHLAVPGPDGARGFGGSCLPKDMAALIALARALDQPLDVVEAAVEANRRWRSPFAGGPADR